MLSGSPNTLVRVQDLYKSFVRGNEEIQVLKKLTLEVARGEFLALMGPSGSGKTTLLNLIAGLDQPTGGSITVDGEVISEMSESQLARWRTRNVGFVFQFYYLLPVLTAYENVELPLLLLPMSKEQAPQASPHGPRSRRAVQSLDSPPGDAFRGQQQRVGIARAMVTDPALIVADEPTGDLDSKSADEILKLMQILCEQVNKTIIMVTHDPHAAEKSQRTLHLDKGRLVEDDDRTRAYMRETPPKTNQEVFT